MTLRFTHLLIAAALGTALASGLAVLVRPALAETNPDEAISAPRPITQRAAELGALLEGAGWVHKGDARIPVYTVGFRSCPDCVAQKEGGYAKLEAAGADLRRIIYARADVDGKQRSKPGERAMVAELWKTRDFALYERWYETDPITFYDSEPLPPSADDNGERAALVEKGRSTVKQMNNILAANGVPLYVPAIFWQENGQWMVYIGYDPATFDTVVVARLAAL